MLAKVYRQLSNPATELSNGCTAQFFRINKRYGFKFFVNRYGHTCQKNTVSHFRSSQLKAFKAGCAPRPRMGQLIPIRYKGNESWGFITEAVERTVFDVLQSSYPHYHRDDIHDMWEDSMEYDELCERMHNAGLSTLDLHSKNAGYLPDGRLVCIDFS